MHPFDIKAALLARHAQHVVLIHFPIALFIAGVAGLAGEELHPLLQVCLSRPETGGERGMCRKPEMRPTWSSTIRGPEWRIRRASRMYLIAIERL